MKKNINNNKRRKFLGLFSIFLLNTSSFSKMFKFKSKRIALCVGHNQYAKGAIGNCNINEYDFNKKLLIEIVNELDDTYSNKNVYKIFYRRGNVSYIHQQKILHKEIQYWGNVDYAIEFHFNASHNNNVDGHEILYLSHEGKRIAIKLERKFNKYLRNRDRGVKLVSHYGRQFLNKGKYASIIAEPFFASHQHCFVDGGKRREGLKKAYKEFLIELGDNK